ncbi:unnamed protein product, partial [Dicrocoelium dendriticum]
MIFHLFGLILQSTRPFPFPAPAALLHCTQKTICTRLAMFLLQSHLIFRSLTDRCLIFLCNVRSHSSIFGPSKLTSSYPSEKGRIVQVSN